VFDRRVVVLQLGRAVLIALRLRIVVSPDLPILMQLCLTALIMLSIQVLQFLRTSLQALQRLCLVPSLNQILFSLFDPERPSFGVNILDLYLH